MGIDLTIEEGKGSATTAQQVATGQTDVGFADAPAAMQIRSKGAPLKIIAPILQTNGFAIISIEGSGIKSPKDLVGKKLAVQPGTAQTTLLDAILAENKLDKTKLDIVNIDPAALVGALLEKKVDAILAGADFQSVQMRDRGFKVNDIFYRDVGVPTVGLSIIARDDRLKESPDLYRNFVAASLKGWDEARKNPDAAAAAVIEQFPSASKDQILKQLNVDLLLVCAPGATSLGTGARQELADDVRLADDVSQSAEGQTDRRLLQQRFPAGQRAEVLTVQAPTAIEARPSAARRRRFDREPRRRQAVRRQGGNVHRARGRVVRHTAAANS